MCIINLPQIDTYFGSLNLNLYDANLTSFQKFNSADSEISAILCE